jgi:TolB-like protein
VAVLPLENLSHDPEQEYFVDGMTDALITDLAKIHALRVISRTSVMQYKGGTCFTAWACCTEVPTIALG